MIERMTAVSSACVNVLQYSPLLNCVVVVVVMLNDVKDILHNEEKSLRNRPRREETFA